MAHFQNLRTFLWCGTTHPIKSCVKRKGLKNVAKTEILPTPRSSIQIWHPTSAETWKKSPHFICNRKSFSSQLQLSTSSAAHFEGNWQIMITISSKIYPCGANCQWGHSLPVLNSRILSPIEMGSSQYLNTKRRFKANEIETRNDFLLG